MAKPTPSERAGNPETRTMLPLARSPLGRRLREARRAMRLTQADLAEQVGVSTSYLNLIENDKRPIGGALLNRIASAVGCTPMQLSGAEDMGLINDILALAPSLGTAEIDEESALRLVAQEPTWAAAIQRLHRRYQDATETAVALSERLSQDPQLLSLTHALLNRVTAIKSMASILSENEDLQRENRQHFTEVISSESDMLGSNTREIIALLESSGIHGSGEALTHPASATGPTNQIGTDRSIQPGPMTPKNEVDDFIIYSGNFFPDIEDAALAMRETLGGAVLDNERGLSDTLVSLGVPISLIGPGDRRDTPEPTEPDTEEPDANAQKSNTAKDEKPALILHAQAPATTRRFQMARRLFEESQDGVISTLTREAKPSSVEAELMIQKAISNYAAGALLAPYSEFLQAAKRFRYDIDRLAFEFGLSFEQTAHRLVTLRRPGEQGVPFAFLRADPAGNLTKPFSIQGLRMPRLGTACSLWVLYQAFSSPDKTLAQLAVMPQGERFLFVAKRVAKRMTAFGAPQSVYSVMLGCDAGHADEIVYGDAFRQDSDTLVTPTGSTCSACSRERCEQRASPFILSPFGRL